MTDQIESRIQKVTTVEDQQSGEHILQPFEQCSKRELWDQLYSPFFKLEIEKEKEKILITKKQPRKPLSPYIFFSQEKRKQIKQENNMSAKAIMKQVSKCWQDIKNDKVQTQKYEYLSLRDREAYAILCKFCLERKKEFTGHEIEDQVHVSLRSHDHLSHTAEGTSQAKINYEQPPRNDSKLELHLIKEEESNTEVPSRDFGQIGPVYTNIQPDSHQLLGKRDRIESGNTKSDLNLNLKKREFKL